MKSFMASLLIFFSDKSEIDVLSLVSAATIMVVAMPNF